MRIATSTFCVLSFLASASRADDGATSIAAGGLVAKREPRVTMAKEVLTISIARVTKMDANHFRAHSTNLVPHKELHIGFYSLARQY